MQNERITSLRWRWARFKQSLKIQVFTFARNHIEINGVKLALGAHLSNNIKEAILDKHYEAAEIKMIEKKIDGDDVIMEIGAGIGFISTYCAKKVGSSNVHAYEANPALEKHIKHTHKINGVSPTLNICLLSDKEGQCPFYIEKDFWSSSMIRRSEEAQEVQVPMKLLNEEIKRLNPSFLIVDIEGGEYHLFQYIDMSNIKKIAIELHNKVLGQNKINVIKKKLQDLGFNVDMSVSNVIPNYKEELYFERVITPSNVSAIKKH